MTDTVKELRKWVIQIRKANFEGNSFDLCDDDDLLWRAAYEIERLRRQVEALKAKNRHSAPSKSSADPSQCPTSKPEWPGPSGTRRKLSKYWKPA